MGLDKFKSQVIFLDTAPLIYFIEGNTVYQKKLAEIFTIHKKGNFSFITSTLTLIEVLVHPMKLKRWDLVNQYKNILTNAAGIEIIEISVNIALKAAELRAKYGLKTPDFIQIATALECQINYFLTNDKRLKVIEELNIITPEDI